MSRAAAGIAGFEQASEALRDGARVVASVSGGKDSTAMCLALRRFGISFVPVFLDTGWESAETYAYVRDELPRIVGDVVWLRAEVKVRERYQSDVEEIENALGHYSAFVRLAVWKGMFPSRTRRWCTQELKVYTIRRWIRDQAFKVVNSLGIRHEESAARASLPAWEAFDGDAFTWRPLIGWTLDDVVAEHAAADVRPHPGYLSGASRVGCWPCIHARKAEIRRIADTDPARIQVMRDLERLVQRVASDRNAKNDAPSFFQAPIANNDGSRDEKCWPIDRVVAWSKTGKGGRQFELFDPKDADAGCMRWGLCDFSEATP
jgi:3'-phosphoadenosine 5'-phosphosulfate sulfotransferase (PAPS reductase)/FAD synthetase